jgi:hypothetical protein
MKNFALLNENNVVINISIADENWDSTGWIDYTNKTCAIGYTYDLDEDIFIAPQPYPSWSRAGSFWNAPTPRPTDDKFYLWDEATTSWVEAPAL